MFNGRVGTADAAIDNAVAAAVDVIVVAAPIADASAVDEMVALVAVMDAAAVALNFLASSSCHGQYFINGPSGTLLSSFHLI